MKKHPFETQTRELLEALFNRCKGLWMEHPAFDGPEASALLGAVEGHLQGAEAGEDWTKALAETFGKAVARNVVLRFVEEATTPRALAYAAFVDRLKFRAKKRKGLDVEELVQQIDQHTQEMVRIGTQEHQSACGTVYRGCAPFCTFHNRDSEETEETEEDE